MSNVEMIFMGGIIGSVLGLLLCALLGWMWVERRDPNTWAMVFGVGGSFWHYIAVMT